MISISEGRMLKRDQQVSFFAAFAARGVEYVVVGGVAVNAHGFLRNTKDLDVFIRPSVSNAERAFQALSDIGAPLDGLEASDLLIDYEHFKLMTPSGSIDVLASIGELTFDQAWGGRVETTIDGVPVTFISRDDLIQNKLQVGRAIDIADVEELRRLADTVEVQLPQDR